MSKTLIKYLLAEKKNNKKQETLFSNQAWHDLYANYANLIYDIQGIDKKK